MSGCGAPPSKHGASAHSSGTGLPCCQDRSARLTGRGFTLVAPGTVSVRIVGAPRGEAPARAHARASYQTPVSLSRPRGLRQYDSNTRTSVRPSPSITVSRCQGQPQVEGEGGGVVLWDSRAHSTMWEGTHEQVNLPRNGKTVVHRDVKGGSSEDYSPNPGGNP